MIMTGGWRASIGLKLRTDGGGGEFHSCAEGSSLGTPGRVSRADCTHLPPLGRHVFVALHPDACWPGDLPTRVLVQMVDG
jgi:hypothetical protein